MADVTHETSVCSMAVLDLSKSDGFGAIAKTGPGFAGQIYVHRVGNDLMLRYADGSAIRVAGLQG
ncbi:MAG: hypothetical protein AAGB05_07715 [Pseudomonadota bacterium]